MKEMTEEETELTYYETCPNCRGPLTLMESDLEFECAEATNYHKYTCAGCGHEYSVTEEYYNSDDGIDDTCECGGCRMIETTDVEYGDAGFSRAVVAVCKKCGATEYASLEYTLNTATAFRLEEEE